MIFVNFKKALLIYKAPPDPHPDLQTRIRIARRCKRVIRKAKTAVRSHFRGVQVFCPDESLKAPDAELQESSNRGPVLNGHRILVKKLSKDRRIAVRFI